jgi:hypothetical protein
LTLHDCGSRLEATTISFWMCRICNAFRKLSSSRQIKCEVQASKHRDDGCTTNPSQSGRSIAIGARLQPADCARRTRARTACGPLHYLAIYWKVNGGTGRCDRTKSACKRAPTS